MLVAGKNAVSSNQHCFDAVPQELLGSVSSVWCTLSVPLLVSARPGSLTQQELPARALGASGSAGVPCP